MNLTEQALPYAIKEVVESTMWMVDCNICFVFIIGTFLSGDPDHLPLGQNVVEMCVVYHVLHHANICVESIKPMEAFELLGLLVTQGTCNQWSLYFKCHQQCLHKGP